MKIKFLTAIAFIMTIVISDISAQSVRSGKSQRQRINQGVRSGELTKAEAINLRKGQKEMREAAKIAKQDGVITKEERKQLKRERKQERRRIAAKKNNGRDRN